MAIIKLDKLFTLIFKFKSELIFILYTNELRSVAALPVAKMHTPKFHISMACIENMADRDVQCDFY